MSHERCQLCLAVKFWAIDEFIVCKSSIHTASSFENSECLYLEGYFFHQYYPAVVFLAPLLMILSKIILKKHQINPRTNFTLIIACDMLYITLLVAAYLLIFRPFSCTLTHMKPFGYHQINFYCILKNIFTINLILFLCFLGVLVDSALTIFSIFAKVRDLHTGHRLGGQMSESVGDSWSRQVFENTQV